MRFPGGRVRDGANGTTGVPAGHVTRSRHDPINQPLSTHITKHNPFHVGKDAVVVRQLQQALPLDPGGKRAATSCSAFASSSHSSTVKGFSTLRASRTQSVTAISLALCNCGRRLKNSVP